jgi:hypothetical protein
MSDVNGVQVGFSEVRSMHSVIRHTCCNQSTNDAPGCPGLASTRPVRAKVAQGTSIHLQDASGWQAVLGVCYDDEHVRGGGR